MKYNDGDVASGVEIDEIYYAPNFTHKDVGNDTKHRFNSIEDVLCSYNTYFKYITCLTAAIILKSTVMTTGGVGMILIDLMHARGNKNYLLQTNLTYLIWGQLQITKHTNAISVETMHCMGMASTAITYLCV